MNIFISYNRQDFSHAETLYDELNAEGHKVWMDIKNLQSGVNWKEQTKNEIRNTDLFLLIVSPWSLNSITVMEECEIALQNNRNFLLLVVQSIRPGQEFNLPIGLPWIDVRSRPLESVALILKWFQDHDVAEVGCLPIKFSRSIVDVAPKEIHLLASVGILVSVIGCLLYISSFSYLKYRPVFNNNLQIIDELFRFLLFLSCYFLVDYFRSVLQIYNREGNEIIGMLKWMRRVLIVNVFSFLVLSYLYSEFINGISEDLKAKEVSQLLIFSVSFLGLLILTLPYNKFVSSPIIKRWLPAFNRKLIKHRFQSNIPSPRIWYNNPNKLYFLFSEVDKPYALRLEKTMIRNGFLIITNKNINYMDEVVILIISSWSMRDMNILKRLNNFSLDRTPIIPIILENIPDNIIIPQEIAGLNFIDSRIDFRQAEDNLISCLRGDRFSMLEKIPERLDLDNLSGRIENLSNSNYPTPISFNSIFIAFSIPPLLKMVIPLLFTTLDSENIIYIGHVDLLFFSIFVILGAIQHMAYCAFRKRQISWVLFNIIYLIICLTWVIFMLTFRPILLSPRNMSEWGFNVIKLCIILSELAFVTFSYYKIQTCNYREWIPGGSKFSLLWIQSENWIMLTFILCVWFMSLP